MYIIKRVGLGGLLLGVFCLNFSMNTLGQNKSSVSEKSEKPVRDPFESTILIENQSIKTISNGAFELMVQHRFGTIENSISDLWGIYSSANIRMALQYGITDKWLVGFGTEKSHKMQDFYTKYALLQQTRSGSVPLSLSLYGNLSVDARDKEFFGEGFKTTHRLSYFAQALLARKVSDALSFQLAGSFSHFNSVEDVWQHDMLGIMAGGRMKLTPVISLIAEYHQPISIEKKEVDQKDIKAGAALGIEIATSTHVFQVFVSNQPHLNPQRNYTLNTNSFNRKGISIGFNVTVRF